MRFARLGALGTEIPVVVTSDGTYDLSELTPDIDGRFFDGGGIERSRELLEAGELALLEGADALRRGAPLARPSAVVCVGMNYSAHARESGSHPPTSPIIFLKPPNTVVGPDDAFVLPPGSTKTDWEVELGIVIRSRALYLSEPAEAARHIAGYVVANDISEREHQLELSGGQWSKGKSGPGFTPVGPWLVTPDEVDASDVRLRSWVNGERRQDSSTSDQIFPLGFLVFHLSQYMALEPGDLILTGTPEGVALSGRFPYLSDGDVVEVEIEGMGRQTQRVRSRSSETVDAR